MKEIIKEIEESSFIKAISVLNTLASSSKKA